MQSCGSKTTSQTAKVQSSSSPMPENSLTWPVTKSCISTNRNLTTIREIMTHSKSWEFRTRKETKNNLKASSLSWNICKNSLISSDTTPKEPVSSSPVSRPSTKCNSLKKLLKILHVSSSSPHPINSDHHSSKLKMDILPTIKLKFNNQATFSEMSVLLLTCRAESLSSVQMVSVKVPY